LQRRFIELLSENVIDTVVNRVDPIRRHAQELDHVLASDFGNCDDGVRLGRILRHEITMAQTINPARSPGYYVPIQAVANPNGRAGYAERNRILWVEQYINAATSHCLGHRHLVPLQERLLLPHHELFYLRVGAITPHQSGILVQKYELVRRWKLEHGREEPAGVDAHAALMLVIMSQHNSNAHQ
jgi:hypothetical protein